MKSYSSEVDIVGYCVAGRQQEIARRVAWVRVLSSFGYVRIHTSPLPVSCIYREMKKLTPARQGSITPPGGAAR